MSYALDEIATELREARGRKALTQRDLSALSGIPQGQISRIEKAGVDLRLSSLVELARALDLEVLLVPRKTVPAVKSIIRSSEPFRLQPAITLVERQRWVKLLTELLHQTGGTSDDPRIQDLSLWIQHYPVSPSAVKELRGWFKRLEKKQVSAADAVKSLFNLRNRTVHGLADDTGPSASVHPAYTLDEDDDV
ncbi:helix-turn-helix domain-containing protein [Rhizobium etli]|uniref:helix-turn-helix domain-containing protein n=1 Tax=Rhizobium etli TaxID=29449 RepID=UPI000383A77C|nr:helix-turn-helix transcriptional regulator [Rhizobium etli]AGS25213.1 XRE family transcriptional regulator protein [Rhizobium etli bv. mimosae str. Mim1]